MSSRGQAISENLVMVRSRIRSAAESVERDPDLITLIAVTKNFPVSDLRILYDLGIRQFGENRDQEALAKVDELPSDVDWHFQGQLQSNKLRSISSWAGTIHSLDQISHANKLAQVRAEKSGQVARLKVFIQVNLKPEGIGAAKLSRGGVQPDGLAQLTEKVLALEELELLGLMAVAPLASDPLTTFATLAEIHQNWLHLAPGSRFLSCGMSGDFEAAIRAGATHLRIGSSILGQRQPLI
jgi:pyridoxal phosphate enzyme (YggS family)